MRFLTCQAVSKYIHLPIPSLNFVFSAYENHFDYYIYSFQDSL